MSISTACSRPMSKSDLIPHILAWQTHSHPMCFVFVCRSTCNSSSAVISHVCNTSARCICLTCIPDKNDFSCQVTFCDDPDCLGAGNPDGWWSISSSFGTDTTVHRTTHDILKIRTVIHRLLWPTLSRQAATALECARIPGALPDPLAEGVEDMHENPSEAPEEPSRISKEPSEVPAEPSEAHVEDDENYTESSEQSEATEHKVAPKCNICREPVYMGRCWRCLECKGTSPNSLRKPLTNDATRIYRLHLRRVREQDIDRLLVMSATVPSARMVLRAQAECVILLR